MSDLTYGTVTGQFLTEYGDAADGTTQVTKPMRGTVVFTPVPRLLVTAIPATILPQRVIATLDDEGYLTYQGQRGVRLQATDDANTNPTAWTWQVSQRLVTAESLIMPQASFDIQVPGGQTIDLTKVTPLAASAGTLTIKGDPGPAGVSLSVITAADDMDAITTPGVYVMRVDWAQTGAARFPAHVPEQFYATDGTKLAPTVEPLVFVYTDSRGEVAQQILADAASTTSFSRSVWYREADAGSLVGVFFNLDVNLQQTLPTFTSSITQGGPLNGFGQNWPDGELVLMSGASIDMAAFTTTISWTWMNTIVNVGSAAVPVTSSGGTPLKTPSGHTPSILPGGTATIIGVANFSGDAYWFLSGDLA